MEQVFYNFIPPPTKTLKMKPSVVLIFVVEWGSFCIFFVKALTVAAVSSDNKAFPT